MWKIDAFCVICTFIGSCVWRCLLWYSWTYLEGADLKHILGDLSRCIESNCFFKSDLLNWNEFMNTTMQILGDCQLPIKTQLNSISTHYNTQYILYALHIYKSIKMRRKRERETKKREERDRQIYIIYTINSIQSIHPWSIFVYMQLSHRFSGTWLDETTRTVIFTDIGRLRSQVIQAGLLVSLAQHLPKTNSYR